MTGNEINTLIVDGGYPCNCDTPDLVETHISWVILCDEYAFKIKKPVQYAFLDFSTLEKRKEQCENEVFLNRRLAKDFYLGVVNIVKKQNHLSIENDEEAQTGKIIDYAVKMKKMDPDRRMDILLDKGEVTVTDIHHIAGQLVRFHNIAEVIKTGRFESQNERFNDLKTAYLNLRGVHVSDMIEKAVEQSDSFLKKNTRLMYQRECEGFTRDGHGDLHSRNIFLLEQPVIFDCLEFNDQFRQTDILDELGFFCMDMDALGHPGLGESFLTYYNKLNEVCRSQEENDLFVYYKAYRANVRAKVSLLRAQSARTNDEIEDALNRAHKYLHLMGSYMDSIDH